MKIKSRKKWKKIRKIEKINYEKINRKKGKITKKNQKTVEDIG